MPDALRIWKDSKARRANVPIKTEAVQAVVDSSAPPSSGDKRDKGSTVKTSSSLTDPAPGARETRRVETAVYTAVPGVGRDEMTLEQTRRAEKLEARVQGDREELYRVRAEHGARLV